MSKSIKSTFKLLGAFAVLLYVIHILLGAYLWKDYSQLQQPISDLTATGAPNRNLLLLFTSAYSLFLVVFALSFTFDRIGTKSKLLRWGGICFVMLHIISMSYVFFPEDLPNASISFKGIMHLIVTILIVPFTILSPLLIGIGYLKDDQWKTFGIYSIITSILILILGTLTGIYYANKYSYFGIVERLNIGSLQLWTFVFSICLFRQAHKLNREV